jgi:hypothetical protein
VAEVTAAATEVVEEVVEPLVRPTTEPVAEKSEDPEPENQLKRYKHNQCGHVLLRQRSFCYFPVLKLIY